MTVRVLCDRGLQSLRLWTAIHRQGRHPYLRYDRHMTFQAMTGPRWPVWRAFRCKRRGTGLVLAVATLWVLAHGTCVEKALLRG